ncbi:MAG: AAA family ATPase [Candidatus Limiplasma sp.]|nr:AAA family ATPase [Candidatus Limiplasma sp.]
MLYLSRFAFPDDEKEFDFLLTVKRKCYNSFYPFKVLSARGLLELEMEPVTILYGGNGSGKTTALNVMAEALKLHRDSRYNRSSFFEDYIALCTHELRGEIPERSRVITSDDVFDFMLNLRAVNAGVDEKREELFQEYLDAKYSDFHFRTMEDYDRLKTVNMARSNTQSRYVRKNLMENLSEHSNGESAFLYFTQRIEEDGLYLLDEPENSLSPTRQQELCQFIEDSARFFHCQFLIATHSPFLLAMRGAKVYDLDANPVTIRRWTELPAVRAYYDFFQAHAKEF